MKVPHLRFALAFLLLLTACGSSKDEDAKEEPKVEKEEKIKEPVPICPQVAILRDLERISDYGTEKPDPAELVAQAKMMAVEGDCGYVDTGIDIKFELSFVAQKGPRLGGLHTSMPFFISVIDPEGKILNKEKMTEEFGFASDSKITQKSENLHVFIPLDKSIQAQGPGYQVLVGFQLTQDQLDTVRQKHDVPAN